MAGYFQNTCETNPEMGTRERKSTRRIWMKVVEIWLCLHIRNWSFSFLLFLNKKYHIFDSSDSKISQSALIQILTND